MLYQNYIKLIKTRNIDTGFSHRIPDYATRYWFDALDDALKNTHNKHAFLDIGAGSGRLSHLLLKSGFASGTAIEVCPDPKAWAPIHQQYPHNLTLITGLIQETLSQLISAQKKYNFILLSEVFEHIPQPDIPPFLDTLKKLLAPDGIIFLTTPNATVQGPAEKSHMWHERQPYGHHKHYTQHELHELLFSYNLDIKQACFEGHTRKSKLYDRFYYPITRWDAKLMHTSKVPHIIRKTYELCSLPAIYMLKPVFWAIAKRITSIQKEQNNEHNSQTIMLVITHRRTNA